jgi:hypothetical protein
MKKICIFHFSPLELFPPVMNMLAFLEKELPEDCSIRVYTTYPKSEVKLFEPTNKRIKIRRLGKYNNALSMVKRLQLYVTYNFLSFADALTWGPGKVFYYETSSAAPPYLLKKLKPSLRLFIHYHEYITPEEYNKVGLWKRLLILEKKIYNKAEWISHTNEDRLQLFVQDTGIVKDGKLHALPNFPSMEWNTRSDRPSFSSPVKIVYVGAIGFDALYIKEFASWVEAQAGKVTWEIYSQQDDSSLKSFLKEINSQFITVKGFIPYHQMPEVLGKYDVGVILYKGLSPNFIYNAPNKLFEYLACGLDVWFSQEIKGAYPYIRTESYPKVISVPFNSLELNLEKLIDREHLSYTPTTYYCEEQYKRIKNLLLQ